MDSHCNFSEDDEIFSDDFIRQILLLTADDDGDDWYETNSTTSTIASSKPRTNTTTAGLPVGSPPTGFVWRASSGTGVFIPCINKPRRKCKTGDDGDQFQTDSTTSPTKTSAAGSPVAPQPAPGLLWKASNGTGVFIPYINQSKTNRKTGRMDKE